MSRSVLLKLEEGWPTRDHAYYVRLLLSSGVKADEIKQVDLHGQAGTCIVTVSCPAVRDEIIAKGITVNGQSVQLSIATGAVVSVHVFGVEDDLSLSAIVTAVSKFGTVIGSAKREKKSVDGCSFTTGTVYLNVALRTAIPCLIAVGSRARKYRVWHQDQRQTCWRCNAATHLAKDCPNKPTRKSSSGQQLESQTNSHSNRQASPSTETAMTASEKTSEAGPTFADVAKSTCNPVNDHERSDRGGTCTSISAEQRTEALLASAAITSVAVQDDDAGTPEADQGENDEQGNDAGTCEGDQCAESLMEDNSKDEESLVSTSWADSTRTDDELELDAVDSMFMSTPQTIPMKRTHIESSSAKKKKKKKKSKS